MSITFDVMSPRSEVDSSYQEGTSKFRDFSYPLTFLSLDFRTPLDFKCQVNDPFPTRNPFQSISKTVVAFQTAALSHIF